MFETVSDKSDQSVAGISVDSNFCYNWLHYYRNHSQKVYARAVFICDR